MTKLYTVTIEYDYVIAVESDEDEFFVAEDVFRDVKYDMDSSNVSMFVREMKHMPEGWDAECHPYRIGSPEKRISEFLKETQ